MELEETIEYYHPNVSDRIPDHILWYVITQNYFPGIMLIWKLCGTLQVSTYL